jgi:hypothetical protein
VAFWLYLIHTLLLAALAPIQEDYVLSWEPVRAELVRAARKAGLRTTPNTEIELFRFLSLAVEQHLSTLLYNMVRLHLQRVDVGK